MTRPRALLRRLLRSSLTGTSAWTLLVKVVGTAATFGANILAARFLGPSEYGVFAFYWSVVAIASTVAALGTSQLLVREISRYRERDRPGLLAGLLRTTFALPLLAGLVLGVAVSLGLQWSHPPTVFDPTAFTAAVTATVLLYVYTTRSQMALRGLDRIVEGLIPDHLIRPPLFLAAVALLIHFGGLAGGDVVLAARAGAYGVAAVAVALLALRLRPDDLRAAARRYDLEGWRRTAVPLLLIAIVEIAHQHLGIVLLTGLSSPEDTGVFRAAYEISRGLVLPLTIAQTVASPTIARLHAREGSAGVDSLYRAVTAVLLAATLPVGLAVAAFGPEILGLLYGGEYAAGGPTLAVLVAARLVRNALGPVYITLVMFGDERRVSRFVTAGAAGSLLLYLILIPALGRMGAALTDLVHTAVVFGGLAVILRRDHSILPWKLPGSNG